MRVSPTRVPETRRSCYTGDMNREAIIARLRENEAALRARGVAHAALLARGRAVTSDRTATPISWSR